MFVDCAFDTIDADPADEIFSPGWGFSLKIHDASGANDHVDSRADWAAGHARSFMHGDLFVQIFSADEGADSLQQRRAIVDPRLSLVRAQFQRGALDGTLAFGADVNSEPVHSRKP